MADIHNINPSREALFEPKMAQTALLDWGLRIASGEFSCFADACLFSISKFSYANNDPAAKY
jgi:hypothetical protein